MFQSYDPKQRQVIRFLADPARANYKNLFTDNEDRAILRDPGFEDHHKAFRFHGLWMECVRRNQVSFEPRDAILIPAIIQMKRIVCLRFSKQYREKFLRSSLKPILVTNAFKAGKYNLISIFVFCK